MSSEFYTNVSPHSRNASGMSILRLFCMGVIHSRTNWLSPLQVIECFRNAQLYQRENVASGRPPTEMVVLFTWLGAKQKYAHKYANCWTRRGYDVLHVTTSVRDLLFPKNGAEVGSSLHHCFWESTPAYILMEIHVSW